MARYLGSRLLQALVATFGVLTLVFFVLHLSGDPTLLLVPEGASAQQIAELRHALGFDRPLLVQYLSYLNDMAHLDLGQSLVQRAPVGSDNQVMIRFRGGERGDSACPIDRVEKFARVAGR